MVRARPVAGREVRSWGHGPLGLGTRLWDKSRRLGHELPKVTSSKGCELPKGASNQKVRDTKGYKHQEVRGPRVHGLSKPWYESQGLIGCLAYRIGFEAYSAVGSKPKAGSGKEARWAIEPDFMDRSHLDSIRLDGLVFGTIRTFSCVLFIYSGPSI
ncbi:hypothetical protein F2Q69_00051954 [Brassica cretica]|uniref:Uncharacterized protein n=1 Tax=Brassica cretica TaxID=69181 RepID=A0A8S9MUW1_BRACR|nr:hypothetical protein F2Q69_00051954 [Brassica cretica]